MTPETSLSESVSHVGRLLDAVGAALVDGRVEPLLQTEQHLEPAVHALAAFAKSPFGIEREDPVLLRAALVRCRTALARCRRLGSSLEDFAAMRLESTRPSATYTRAGLAASGLSSGSRTGGLQVRG